VADDQVVPPAADAAPAAPDASSVPSLNPIVDALTKVLPTAIGRARIQVSPYPFGVSDDDNLRVTLVPQVLPFGDTITVNYRVLRRNGETAAGSYVFDPNVADPLGGVRALGGGWIVNAIAFLTSGSPVPGSCFIKVELVRGLTGGVQGVGTMIQGVLNGANSLSWPGSPLLNSLDGPPIMDYNQQPAIVAGNDWSLSITDNTRRALQQVCFVLSTSGAAGNRQVFFRIFNGFAGTTLFIPCHTTPIGPLTVSRFTLGAGLGYAQDFIANNAVAGLPVETILEKGCTFGTVTVGLNALDLYSQIAFVDAVLVKA
jgi:hypothetical protein